MDAEAEQWVSCAAWTFWAWKDGKRTPQWMPSGRTDQTERPGQTVGAAVNTGVETSENKALPQAQRKPMTLALCKQS